MTKLNYILLFMLSFATHTHLHAAQMNVEMKEQEKKQLSAEEQAAADKMFEIIHATYKDNAAQQAQALQKLLQRYPRIVDAKSYHGWTHYHGLTHYHGWTPLMHAIGYNNAEIVKLLITAGAQIDAQDNDGWTPLMIAASNDNPEIVKLLIAAGAQIDAQDNDGRTARDIAILYNRKEIYDNAVTAGLAEKERYEQAQQVAKQKITEVMFPDEIEEPEITEIIGEYAYNPAIPADLPKETKSIKQQSRNKK